MRLSRDGGRAVAQISGGLDSFSVPLVRQLLEDVIDGQGNLFVDLDLSKLTFIDAQGLEVLVCVHRRLQGRGGKLTLVGLRPATYQALQATGLGRAFQIEAPHSPAA